MKNILDHNGTSQIMLGNVNDGTNTLYINGALIPSSQWVGTGNYTQVIGSVTITIEKISNLSGNVMLQKIGENTYRLINNSGTGSGNYLIWA